MRLRPEQVRGQRHPVRAGVGTLENGTATSATRATAADHPILRPRHSLRPRLTHQGHGLAHAVGQRRGGQRRRRVERRPVPRPDKRVPTGAYVPDTGTRPGSFRG